MERVEKSVPCLMRTRRSVEGVTIGGGGEGGAVLGLGLLDE